MTDTSAASPGDPDHPSLALLLASDPLDWARRTTLLVYDRHATTVAARAERRGRQLDGDGERASAETVRRDAVNLLRHACTNYEELVADVAAHYGRGRRDDVIDVLRHRALRALAYRFPGLADACRTVAQGRRSAPESLPSETSVRQARVRGSD